MYSYSDFSTIYVSQKNGNDVSGDITMYYYDELGKYISLDEWNEKVCRPEEGARFSNPEVNDAEKCDFSMTDDSFAVKSGFEKLK